MIEFSGHLTGSAEKRYFNKSRELVQYIALGSLAIGLLNYRTLAQLAQIWPPIKVTMYIFYGICLLSPLWLRINIKNKHRLANTPHRIAIDDGYIICIADAFEEGREVSDVKRVRDFGAFYELVFSFNRASYKFICQKDLLTQGSLEEFEKLFEGKLERQQRS